MKKHVCKSAALCWLLLAVPAWPASFDEIIVAQLRDQGYTSIQVSRTLLGRIRIDAVLGVLHREIVINPRTGEILRDYQAAAQMADAQDSADSPAAATTTAVEVVPTVTDLSTGDTGPDDAEALGQPDGGLGLPGGN